MEILHYNRNSAVWKKRALIVNMFIFPEPVDVPKQKPVQPDVEVVKEKTEKVILA